VSQFSKYINFLLSQTFSRSPLHGGETVVRPRTMRNAYEYVSKSYRTESIKKYTLITINTRREATQRAMAAKFTRLTHKIAIQLHLVAKGFTTCISHSRQPVRILLDTPCISRLGAEFETIIPVFFFGGGGRGLDSVSCVIDFTML
jgi:hypothetical protein